MLDFPLASSFGYRMQVLFFFFFPGSFNMERMLQRKIKTLQLEPLILGFGLELLLI